jgi:hypothetical protein
MFLNNNNNLYKFSHKADIILYQIFSQMELLLKEDFHILIKMIYLLINLEELNHLLLFNHFKLILRKQSIKIINIEESLIKSFFFQILNDLT